MFEFSPFLASIARRQLKRFLATPQDGPRGFQEHPKTAQEGSRTAQEDLKIAPGRIHEGKHEL
eukprot:7751650-Pyramimonas_sp.AAC.1